MAPRRVIADLNTALHRLLEQDNRAYLIGEDLLDPYGGAFGASRGLSTRFPDQVISTPISEAALIGMASGMALCGDHPIVEVMFGDVLTLCFDALVNFAAKSVSMYGRRLPMPLIVRSPVGGRRGYGPTHSQNLQKHFLGVPNLALYEMSPYVDNFTVFEHMLGRGEPCLFFEDKALYTAPMRTSSEEDGPSEDALVIAALPGAELCVRVGFADIGSPDQIIITPGGVAGRALEAARRLLVEHETVCEVIVPSRLYPLDLDPLLPVIAQAGRVCVVEDGVVGSGWGTTMAHSIHTSLWERLLAPVTVVGAPEQIIPSARHLEERAAVDATTIFRALCEVGHA